MDRIRRSTHADVPAIAELLRQAYTPESLRDGDPGVLQRVASRRTVEAAIEREEMYVVEEGGRIVATATLKPVAYLRRIATLPEEQGRGHAESLLGHLVRAARREGYSVAALDADAKIPWLEEWYHRRGFNTVATKEYLDAGFRTRYMELKFKGSTKGD